MHKIYNLSMGGVINKNLFCISLIYRQILFVFLFLLFFNPGISQEIKIGRINDLNYPDMECTFIATDPGGDKNFSLQINDFAVSENFRNAEVIEVINPEGEGKPVSVVLVFDISASMKNERLALAKDAAFEFLKQFPLETSEVAIASFSDNVYLNCDFTQDNNRLNEAITDLEPFSGTNYSKAFLFNQTGAMDIAHNGKYKKAIVFLTDGLSSASSAEIIKRANYEGITVYCISMALAMPEVLKNIAIQTGGRYYEAISNIYQLHNFYASICQLLQTSGYSILRWRAIDGCERKRKVKLTCHNNNLEFGYEVSGYLAGSLMADPTIVFFGENTLQGQSYASISLIAKNQSFTISDISLKKNEYFAITDTLKFPFQINKGESKQINLVYNNKEAGLISDKLVISSAGCPTIGVTLNGGMEEQLKIVAPVGGEVFSVGMDTAIIWEGIKRNKNVAIWYRTKENKPWKSIIEANGLYSEWLVPNDTGTSVEVRIEPLAADSRDFRATNRINLSSIATGITSNEDASLILTVDKSGTLQMWDGKSSRLIVSLAGFAIRNAILSSDSKRIIGFTGFEMFVWDVTSFKLVARYSFKQKLYVSDVDPEGFESLLSTRIYKDINDKLRAWSPGSNVLIPIPEKKELSAAMISQNGLKAITLNSDNQLKIWNLTDYNDIANIKIKPEVVSIIISPNGKTFVLVEREDIKAYSTNTGKELFHFPHNIYKKFSGNGNILITSDVSSDINFWDSESGKLLLNINRPVFYKSGFRSNKILFYSNGSLSLKDLTGNIPDFNIINPSIIDATLSPDENLLLVTRNNNTIDFYDIQERKKINTLNEFESQIVQVRYSANSKNILVSTGNKEIVVFKPYTNKILKDAVSGYFSIVAPLLKVKDSILFQQQYLQTNKELFIPDFASNKTIFPILIKRMDIIGKDSADFRIVSNYYSYSLLGNAFKEVEIGFNPQQVGIKEALLRTFTASDTLYTTLIGTSVSKLFKTTHDIIDFGKVKVNEYKDTVVAVLTNTGEIPVIIEKISNTGRNKVLFTLNETYSNITLEAGKSLRISLTFKPKDRGRVSGSLSIWVKECSEIQKVQLFGDGTALRAIVLKGNTLNSISKKPLSAVVLCNDLFSGRIITKFITGVDGNFIIDLNSDRNYGITAEKENFLSGSENIDLSGVTFADTINRDIYLTEIVSGAIIRMNCVFFDFAKWDILPSSVVELDRLAETLKKFPKISIEIHGHTDSIGNDIANNLLSKNRANSVRNYMIKRGTDAKRLSIMFFGERIPVTSNATDEGRARNRRVEVKVR